MLIGMDLFTWIYFSAMVDERSGLKAAYTYDGAHPDEAGYKFMESLAEAAIAKALNRNARGSDKPSPE